MSSKYFDWLKTVWDNPADALNKYSEHWMLTPHWRLANALADSNTGPLDLASLIRSVLRFEEINYPEQLAVLPFPTSITDVITNPNLEKVSIESVKVSFSETFLRSVSWKPIWLPGISYELPDHVALSSTPRRKDIPVPGDPFLRHLEFELYRSVAQREAVRAVLSSAPGQTIVLNLPTGSGKSLAAFLPSLLHYSDDTEQLGVTPIIVPTVSLALDLASKFEPIIGHKIAYRPDDEEAESIRIRCRKGIQGPIIVSPESFVGSLRHSVLSAAKEGYLRYFIIDEAHMVLSWGDEFRPAFQQVSALRNEMLKISNSNPFVTILMSATFTEYHLRWLKRMFSSQNQFTIIHAARLRPEPSYWQVKASTSEERTAWVTDAVLHFPKPLIVYVTKRESTTFWYNYFKNEGLARLAIIHGGMSTNVRAHQIEKWNGDNIDIMIATSAFGLGVDKPNIRAIIHAELPETVDRFYQDVGRSGRDGFGSISLLCWSEQDRKIIKKLQNPSFIGTEKGLKRWRKMFDKKKIISSGHKIFQISLDTPAEMDMNSDLNELWNIRTLLLLERAGVIKLEPPEGANSHKVNVKILKEGHTKPETWEEYVESLRDELKKEYSKSNKLLERLLSQKECQSQIFSDCYSSTLFNINVVRACGGCPSCRGSRPLIQPGKILARRFPENSVKPVSHSDKLESLMNDKMVLYLFYPNNLQGSNALIDRLKTFIRWILDSEIVNIISFPSLTNWLNKEIKSNLHWRFFLHERFPNDVTKILPTIFFISSPLPDWWHEIWSKLNKLLTKTIFVMPKDLVVPDHPERLFRDVAEGEKIEIDTWEDEFLE